MSAATLTQRLADGHKLRLGFGTAVPWAYAGDNGEALGFVNMIALTVLEEMGITEHETKVFEWSGLIPGINANRSDMITGGMYILKSRCANINFSDPIGVFGDAMLVPKGNPKNINTSDGKHSFKIQKEFYKVVKRISLSALSAFPIKYEIIIGSI